METESSQQQKAQSLPLPIVEMPAIAAGVISPAPDELPGATCIGNPKDFVPSDISEEMLGGICTRYGLSKDDVLLPEAKDRPTLPRKGTPLLTDSRAQLGHSLHSINTSRKCYPT